MLNVLFIVDLSVAVDCGAIDVPINGSLKGSKTIFPNSVQFACDSGFVLRGSNVRTCQANGTWDGIETHCDGKLSDQRYWVILVVDEQLIVQKSFPSTRFNLFLLLLFTVKMHFVQNRT